jgi:hypothetical protein
VVLACCGHRGLVNSVKRAMEISGIKKVHAVAGGFHLAPHKEDYVRDTVAALKDINPDCIIPMHCSGETFIDIVQKEMPDKFIRSYTGSRDIFGGIEASASKRSIQGCPDLWAMCIQRTLAQRIRQYQGMPIGNSRPLSRSPYCVGLASRASPAFVRPICASA